MNHDLLEDCRSLYHPVPLNKDGDPTPPRCLLRDRREASAELIANGDRFEPHLQAGRSGGGVYLKKKAGAARWSNGEPDCHSGLDDSTPTRANHLCRDGHASVVESVVEEEVAEVSIRNLYNVRASGGNPLFYDARKKQRRGPCGFCRQNLDGPRVFTCGRASRSQNRALRSHARAFMHPGRIGFVVIGAYLVLMVAIGAVVKQTNADNSDHFGNGCKGTWWLVGSSAFMTRFGAWTSFFLKQVVGINTLTASQRYFGVKTGPDANRASLLAGVLTVLGAFIWFIPPITGRLLFSAEIDGMDIPKPAEASYAVVSMKLLPVGLTGLMVVAMLSATMSSMDSGLNRNAAIFTRNILPACARAFGLRFDPEKPRLRLAQASLLAFGLVIVAITLYFANQDGVGVFEIMLKIGEKLAIPLAVPMALAILVKRVPWWSALVSIACAFSMALVGSYSGTLFDEEWNFATGIFSNVAAGSAGFLATMAFWKTASPAYRGQVDHFFETMHRPVNFAAEVGSGNDTSQMNIIGWFAVVIGGFVCSLVVLPNPVHGRLAILFVGGFVLLTGLLFLWLGSRAMPDAAPPESSAERLP